MKLEQLQEFRQLAYQCLGNAKDVTFELADAVMTTRHISCLGDLASIPYFGVSGRVSMKHYKTVDQIETN